MRYRLPTSFIIKINKDVINNKWYRFIVFQIFFKACQTQREVKLISASPEIAAKTIQTVNSSLFSPRLPVADVKRAVTLLGLKNIRSIALAYATMDALPKPPPNYLTIVLFGRILCFRPH